MGIVVAAIQIGRLLVPVGRAQGADWEGSKRLIFRRGLPMIRVYFVFEDPLDDAEVNLSFVDVPTQDPE